VRPTTARAIVLAAIVSAGARTASADALRGKVIDAVSRQPIAGVSVEAVGTPWVASTDGQGVFMLGLDVMTRPRLRLWCPGYEVVELAPEAREGELGFELRPTGLRISESVVVTAQRESSPAIDVPRSVSILEARELERGLPRTVPEALQGMAGVLVQKTNHGGGSPIIRGLMGNQVLVLVDGIRLNNATFRYGPNQYLATVDPFPVGRIEVVRGLGSVLFGSDALGGVVNVLTRRPELSEEGLRVSGRLTPKLVSSGMEKSGRLQAEAAGPRAAVSAGFSYRDFGDLRAGGGLGVESPSGYGERDGDARALVRLSARHLLHAAYQHVRQEDVPRFDQVAQRGFARYGFDPQVRQLGYLQLESSFDSRLVQHLKVTPSFQRSLEGRFRQSRGSSLEITEKDVVDTGGLAFEARTRLGPGWTLVSGAEYYHDHVASEREDHDLASGARTPRRGLYPDGATAASTAAFVHSSWDSARWAADLGARFNHHQVEADDRGFGSLRLRNQAWVGSGALMWKLNARHRLYAALSQGFRAPNIDDVSTLGAFDFGVETPSTDLKPERTLTYEAGLKTRASRLAAALAVYRTNLTDLIDRVPSTYLGSTLWEGQRVYRRANVGRAYVRGFEGELEWEALRELTVFGALTHTFGQQVSASQPMRRIPPLYGQLGVRWERREGASLGATLLFAGEQDRLAPGDKSDHRIAPGGTPGWKVLNLRAAYLLGRSVELLAGVENVFDEAYRIHGSGIDGAGRNGWVGAQVRF
jgi:hemoglobin/transferrin/lactoferrin receptor protein